MKKSLWIVLAVVIVVAVAGGLLLMHNSDNNKPASNSTADMKMPKQQPSTSDTTKPASPANAVSIEGFAFSPGTTTVGVGTTVTWTNKDSVAHTVTADTTSSDAPASGNIAAGGTYSFTFNKAGTYAYHCSIHTDMKGTVTVTE